ncbi:MAG: hypothetical protein B7733_19110 [Myxococcales bacterium FL481]|nr:MAG: hypothetical protein B7733_19110 [Myxococcales bacterium FL481]
MAHLAQFVAATLRGETLPSPNVEDIRPGDQGTYVSLRATGHLVGDAWRDGPPATALPAALDAAFTAVEAPQRGTIDSAIIEFAHSFATVADEDGQLAHELHDAHRGVRGFSLSHGQTTHIVPPTHMLARSTSFSDELTRLRQQPSLAGLDDEAFARETQLRRFEAVQVRVGLAPDPTAAVMFRGNTVVDASAVTQANTQAWAERAAAWLLQHVDGEGRMTYTWHPGRGEADPDANNMIRQWMASVALGRWARRVQDPAVDAVVMRNLAFNLDRYYVTSPNGDLGRIEYRGRSKLGAIALAALAIRECPDPPRFALQQAALRRQIDSMWQPDGSFTLYAVPAGRRGGMNYYPGEALVYLGEVYHDTRDPELLAKFMTSFRYYKSWHLKSDNRSPPFVPWHTQAYYTVWSATQDPELAAFIFKMNDWLISSMQMWKNADYPDAAGQFFNPRRRQWGRENASSTGVYIEGIADAFAVAKAVGDTRREELYARSLSRALLHLYHLQIVDDIDTFYMPRADRAIGGVRTSMYRDFIRVDNVQHNLMGIMKILDRFDAADYHTEPPA